MRTTTTRKLSVMFLRPVIEEANQDAPAFSRIFKEMIIVTSNGKPLPRVAKGTVAKKAAVKLYEAEIDTLYVADASTINSKSLIGIV